MTTRAPSDTDALAALATLRAWLAAPAPAASVYSSVSLPPGITRRTFNARCRNISEARKDGIVWVVPVDAYDRAVRLGSQSKSASSTEPANDDAKAILMRAAAKLKRAGGTR